MIRSVRRGANTDPRRSRQLYLPPAVRRERGGVRLVVVKLGDCGSLVPGSTPGPRPITTCTSLLLHRSPSLFRASCRRAGACSGGSARRSRHPARRQSRTSESVRRDFALHTSRQVTYLHEPALPLFRRKQQQPLRAAAVGVLQHPLEPFLLKH